MLLGWAASFWYAEPPVREPAYVFLPRHTVPNTAEKKAGVTCRRHGAGANLCTGQRGFGRAERASVVSDLVRTQRLCGGPFTHRRRIHHRMRQLHLRRRGL
jgi:hypothetical protein